jgi:malonyl-CoA O-methyltransferase
MADSPHRPDSPPASLRVDAAAVRRWQTRRRNHPAPWLHSEIARRMADRLEWIKRTPQQVIDWWSRAGGSAVALQVSYPEATILPVEPAHAPPDGPRPSWWQRLRGATAPAVIDDGDAFKPATPVGLLWSNMALHWVNDVPTLLARWHAAIQVDGFLMFSCFGPDTLRQLRTLYREAGWGEPTSAFTDMHDLGDALVQAGFADPVMDMETLTLSWPDADSLLDELRDLGGNSAPQRFAGLRTPRWREQLRQRLTERLSRPDPAGGPARLYLDFEIVYGHAFRPQPRVKVEAQTTIGVEALRQMARSGVPRAVPPLNDPSERRGLLGAGLALLGGLIAPMPLLSGCDELRQRQHFNALNITGASYARSFHLNDAQGRRRSLDEFRGRLVLVFFGYTQCPDVCPTTLTQMVELKGLLGADGERLQVVFVSIDPERDSPALLSNYLGAFDPSFIALRGSAEETAETAREFRIVYRKVPGSSEGHYTMDHTAAFFVFDTAGQVRLYVRPGLPVRDLAADLKALLHPPARS